MDYSFPHYLLSKKTVDDRSINPHVFKKMESCFTGKRLRIIEVGSGIGTMLIRLLSWGFIKNGEYVLVDEMFENIEFARQYIADWAGQNNFKLEWVNKNQVHLFSDVVDLVVTLEQSDVFEFISKNQRLADLIIAHAFLDLLPMPTSLTKLFSLLKPGGLAWLTVNFDGVTTFEPSIDVELDQKIEFYYHKSMDMRQTGGDSKSGRHLFGYFVEMKVEILSAGASDWVVHSMQGKYMEDEGYFLKFILYFFELSLNNHPNLDQTDFGNWLEKRRKQVDSGELVYIAHQMDFLVKPHSI